MDSSNFELNWFSDFFHHQILDQLFFTLEVVNVRIQIGMFRPIRVDHTNCLQVTIKTHSTVMD